MKQAVWNGVVLAESEQTIIVEGNHYFPAESIKHERFSGSETHTVCPWKGVASYYNIEVGGKVNPNAAWYYPQPNEAASKIQGYVSFWRGVEVRDV